MTDDPGAPPRGQPLQETPIRRDRDRRLWWLIIYALAMGLLEAAVVIYLRALHPGAVVLSQVLGALPQRIVTIEVVREAATLVMLVAVAVLTSRERGERFWLFLMAFAVWDLTYYGWLWVLIGWPSSLLTWDVLFLIPVPWTAPVLAPLLVSVLLIAWAIWMLRRRERGLGLAHPGRTWLGVLLGGATILWSFTVHYRVVLTGAFPARYPWGWFALGLLIALAGLISAGSRPTSSPPS